MWLPTTENPGMDSWWPHCWWCQLCLPSVSPLVQFQSNQKGWLNEFFKQYVEPRILMIILLISHQKWATVVHLCTPLWDTMPSVLAVWTWQLVLVVNLPLSSARDVKVGVVCSQWCHTVLQYCVPVIPQTLMYLWLLRKEDSNHVYSCSVGLSPSKLPHSHSKFLAPQCFFCWWMYEHMYSSVVCILCFSFSILYHFWTLKWPGTWETPFTGCLGRNSWLSRITAGRGWPIWWWSSLPYFQSTIFPTSGSEYASCELC